MKLLFYSIIFGVLFGCSSSKKSCSGFREGTFLYLNKEENSFNENQITIRVGNKQTYIDSKKGDTLVYNVEWVSNCNYELILKGSNLNNDGFTKIGDTLSVTIEPIDDVTFNYTSRIKKNYIFVF